VQWDAVSGQGAADAGIAHAAHQAFAVGVGDHAIGATGAHQLQQHLSWIAAANQQTPAALAQFGIQSPQALEHERHPSNSGFGMKQQIPIQDEHRQDRPAATGVAEGCVIAQTQIAPKPHHRARHGDSLAGERSLAVRLQCSGRDAIMQMLHN